MARTSASRSDLVRVSERVQALVAQGLDVVEAYAAARATTPSRELARIEKQQAREAAAHRKAVQRHTTRVASQRRSAVTLTAMSGAAAVIAVVDMAAPPPPPVGSAGLWLGGAAVAAVLAVRTRWTADHATPPEPPAPAAGGVALDARALRRESVGWAQAQGLVAVRRQVTVLVPAVTALHHDAGCDLERADEEAGPVLAALVTRLVLLDQVCTDLPGTTAAGAAASAAAQVSARLADGVARYDGLLAAAAALLAAPDIGRSTADVLGPAADALTAYAHGLSVAADPPGHGRQP